MLLSKFISQALFVSGVVSFTAPANPQNVGQVAPLIDEVNASTAGSASEAGLGADVKNAAVQVQLTADEAEALRLHNDARKKKGLQPLAWDAKLAADARAWASNIAKKNTLQHSDLSSRPGQGENLAYAQDPKPPGVATPLALGTKQWLAEEKLYLGDILSSANFAKFGHYTQIVWKGTTKVGIASVNNGKGTSFVVARYSPLGNILGQKPF